MHIPYLIIPTPGLASPTIQTYLVARKIDFKSNSNYSEFS